MSSLEHAVQAQTNVSVLAERWILTQPPERSLETSLESLAERLDDIERALELRASHSEADIDSWIDQAYGELTSVGLGEILARAIIENASAAWRSLPRSANKAAFRRVLVASIVNELTFMPLANGSEGAPPVIVFAGPPGAGKTTTLIKIAVQEFLKQRDSVRIISVDPHHPSGHEKIRALASKIGASFAAADTVNELRSALRDFSGTGPLLIDTPGYAPSEREALRELAEFLAEVRPHQTHLVLPAWMSKHGLAQIHHQYAPFSADALLFTQLDETDWYGAMIAFALETRRPLSFFACGQNIAEDLSVATPAELFGALYLGHHVESGSAA
jgi:flagellar biosynthesis protein FlhF